MWIPLAPYNQGYGCNSFGLRIGIAVLFTVKQHLPRLR